MDGVNNLLESNREGINKIPQAVWCDQYSNKTGPYAKEGDAGYNNPYMGETRIFRSRVDLSGVNSVSEADLKVNADNAFTLSFDNDLSDISHEMQDIITSQENGYDESISVIRISF